MQTEAEVTVNEKTRTYSWVHNDNVTQTRFDDVKAIRVSKSGNHYLRLGNGDLAIIAPGWAFIDIVPETPTTGWTF